MKVSKGQRWISQTEAQLGLGIVTDIANRRFTLQFPAVDEERIYAIDNTALSRVIYRPGEQISTRNELELTVLDTEEVRGLVFYHGRDAEGSEHVVPETDLDAHVRLSTPRQRLVSGQLDKDALFRLRIELLARRVALQRSSARGLLGCRTSLLPHQIYIAAEVAGRHAPRVLLADEVGLGKTIEAGMIIHQQLHTGRARRVLIVTPDSLQHQWLVEMLRRFNLRFSLFDPDRLEALAASEELNPFDSEQLVICALSMLVQHDTALDAACRASWDLIVVDEAHHLAWSRQEPGPEYQAIAQLAGQDSGLLLLSATPEQAGIDAHFARLRLLDPARFFDADAYREEQQNYQSVNRLARQLLADTEVPATLYRDLQHWLGPAVENLADSAERLDHDAIVRQLLDRHGTGRVMFRNTRAAIERFPERRVHPYPLPLPECYQQPDGGSAGAFPEQGIDERLWIADDPRVAWLRRFLANVKPHKVLIICAHANTATALAYYLHMRAGIRCSAFHEELSLIERDRAAAWFAEAESGAQALVCSEIGSEGRNFQFARHLVLFDLPLHPDLLEQRIGRLDRIGQKHAIDIHVPYLEASAQQTLYRWYHEGMDTFRNSCASASTIIEGMGEQLEKQLHHGDSNLPQLIDDTRALTQTTRRALEQGRDALLELNSCDPTVAQALIDEINAQQQETPFLQFLEGLCDQIGIDLDYHSEHIRVLHPSEHMLLDHVPGMENSAVTITVNREQALAREDIEYLSWEHPMVVEIMDSILNSAIGNTSIVTTAIKSLPPGTLMLEAIFSVTCSARAELQLDRYLAAEPVRVLVNSAGQDFARALSHSQLNQLAEGVKRSAGQAIIKRMRNELEQMLDKAEAIAAAQLPGIITTARQAMCRDLNSEAQRLRSLREINPSIRADEIAHLEQRITSSESTLERTGLQQEGLRLVVNT